MPSSLLIGTARAQLPEGYKFPYMRPEQSTRLGQALPLHQSYTDSCCRGYKPLQPRENTATTHTAIIHTVASHTVNTHTVATHTVTTHTLATHTVATHIAGTHTVAKHITTTHTACTYATTTHTFNAGNKMETKQ